MYKVLIAGCGNMGVSHAKAYHGFKNCEIVGLVSRNEKSRNALNEKLGSSYPGFSNFDEALEQTKPDIVCISTYTETHAEYAIKSMKAGAHVFVEKPLAERVEEAQKVIDTAREYNKKLIVGYILRVHPAWKKFIEIGKTMGSPWVMRLNLNQQSQGYMWDVHKNLMNSCSPIVDCGVHYIDVMCQITGSKPLRVSGIGARLTDEVDANMYNYGQLQVTFDDGSVGWYEAGWGPMMSETAYFVKDIVGPRGSISMIEKGEGISSDIDSHTKTQQLKVHHSKIDKDNNFIRKDELIDTTDEPSHDDLCRMEQETLLHAIEHDDDLTEIQDAAIQSLAVVLAADESFRTERTVTL
ncbi:MAG: Gfo/Idh/MocA family oxidoreductase [Cyclobacteriaceae bacterium]|nr:Gfo/Idh/MocA family oxidoreductase [Cyclobacteriaceae bacterium]